MQKVILHRPTARLSCLSSLWVIFFILLAVAQPVLAEPVKILPFGTWTAGLDGYVSYRYDLWFNLIDAGFDVDFVGTKINPGGGVNLDRYPDYLTGFDRDHYGLEGTLSSDMLNLVKNQSATHNPDIVLLWMGPYDLLTQGAGGVANAKFAIPDAIEGIRQFTPGVTILLALCSPAPPLEAAHVDALNDAIATIASEMDTPESPIIVVDHVTGFDPVGMLYDRHHHNRVGEAWVAGNWFEALANILPTFEFSINAGLNDAWYNPDTDGQGFFITVFPDLALASLAWFTYDTELPAEDAEANLGDAGHRWLTALGPIDGNQVLMNIDIASGGIFDTASDIQHTDPAGSDGTIILTFDSCNSGTVEYDITSIDRQGIVPIRRVVDDNIVLCEALKAD
jgi:hypothetical protein